MSRPREQRLHGLVNRLSFCGLMGPEGAHVRVGVTVDERGRPWFAMTMDVPDRDSGRQRILDTKTGIPDHVTGLTKDRAADLAWLRKALHELWLHEFKEGVLFDDERLHEPHPPIVQELIDGR